MDAREWYKRSVTIRDDRLYWEPDPGKAVRPEKGMLAAFCALGDAPDASILRFASKYGPLMLCEHGLPCTHHGGDCYPLGWYDRSTGGGLYDPLEMWRRFAREASALLKVADRLLRGEVGEAQDWRVIYGRSGQPITGRWWDKPHHQQFGLERSKVASVVNEWLELGNARPVVAWHAGDQRPTLKLGGLGLFSALALQLALAIGQGTGTAVCVHCRQEYRLIRRPKTGQRNFCPDCREAGIPTRLSVFDYRERQRRGRDRKR